MPFGKDRSLERAFSAGGPSFSRRRFAATLPWDALVAFPVAPKALN